MDDGLLRNPADDIAVHQLVVIANSAYSKVVVLGTLQTGEQAFANSSGMLLPLCGRRRKLVGVLNYVSFSAMHFFVPGNQLTCILPVLYNKVLRFR